MDEIICKNCCSQVLKLSVDQLKKNVNDLRSTIDRKHLEYENRIRGLEDWKLVFVAKFSVYAAIALFIGSIVSQLLIYFISQQL